MANTTPRRFPNLHGTLNNGSSLGSGATSTVVAYDASSFSLPAVASTEFFKVTLEPGTANEEVIWVNGSLSAAATTWGSIVRGKEGTSGVSHANGTPWVASICLSDFDGKDGGSGLIALTASAVADTDVNTTSTTLVDADATNLAVTFTAPPSGSVLIRLTAWPYINAQDQDWGLRESTTIVAGPTIVTNSNGDAKACMSFVVTGLTPGSSHTYKWAYSSPTGTAAHLRYGGVTTSYGSGIMEVWAVPF